uniref:Uncharacterized protein n=1 Tax=Arabidopsis thaliana TaxID=3702 RepID=Q56ZN7_ARATH|nr:hypothetical protein [Arabidopsis thaliana]
MSSRNKNHTSSSKALFRFHPSVMFVMRPLRILLFPVR